MLPKWKCGFKASEHWGQSGTRGNSLATIVQVCIGEKKLYLIARAWIFRDNSEYVRRLLQKQMLLLLLLGNS